MKARAKASFWRSYNALPEKTQKRARVAFHQWLNDPSRPSLQFKQVRSTRPPLYSARVDEAYRVLGVLQGDTLYWIWIGSHDDYERMIGGW